MASCVQVKPRIESRRYDYIKEDSISFQNLQKCNREAFKFINEGLDQEDKGDIENAILCYKKGLRVIESGTHSKDDIVLSLSTDDATKYRDLLAKISRAQKEIIIRLETLKTDEIQPSAPPLLDAEDINEMFTDNLVESEGNKLWQDVKELLSITEGVGLFHVDRNGGVSSWALAEATLQVFQLLKENVAEKVPPAFLKCGDWVYPMEPGKSPVLKTQHRTYMFPDINMDNNQELDPSKMPCVGVVLADIVPDAVVKRFERILSCYGDFRKEFEKPSEKTKPKRPPPPSATKTSNTSSKYTVSTDTITVESGTVDTVEVVEEKNSWSAKVAAGINVGSHWISWGLLKGAEYTGILVEKGANSIRGRIKPNEEEKTVDPQISHNIRQLHQATGSVVQVSEFLVTALGSLTVNLGKKLAPHVYEKGQNLLPMKYRPKNNTDSQRKMEGAKTIAYAGLKGFSLMFLALEQAGGNLYCTISTATVKTMQHKYGEEVGEVTHDAMTAVGNAFKTYRNVSQLGPKAIAKRTLKDTGKAMIIDEEGEEHKENERDNLKILP